MKSPSQRLCLQGSLVCDEIGMALQKAARMKTQTVFSDAEFPFNRCLKKENRNGGKDEVSKYSLEPQWSRDGPEHSAFDVVATPASSLHLVAVRRTLWCIFGVLSTIVPIDDEYHSNLIQSLVILDGCLSHTPILQHEASLVPQH